MSASALPAALDRFREVWAVDFEFIAHEGERPDPVCMVARELRTGVELRLWDTELRSTPCPFSWGPDSVMLAYSAPAELSCFLALDWPMPTAVLDLFIEFLCLRNGRAHFFGKSIGLLAALAHFGLSHMSDEAKGGWRDRIIAGRPYSESDRAGILDYCATDADALRALLPHLVGRLAGRPRWLEHALLRGRYQRAIAAMEPRGVPIDVLAWSAMASRWDRIKVELVQEICADVPVFEGSTLKHDRFADWLVAHNMPCSFVNTIDGLLAEPQLAARGMVMEYDHPKLGPLHAIAYPVQFNGEPREADRPPPLLGQHSDEVLREAGCSAGEIAALRKQGGVVG